MSGWEVGWWFTVWVLTLTIAYWWGRKDGIKEAHQLLKQAWEKEAEYAKGVEEGLKQANGEWTRAQGRL